MPEKDDQNTNYFGVNFKLCCTIYFDFLFLSY